MSIFIDEDMCKGCGVCVVACPTQALSMVNDTPDIDQSLCNECLQCIDECPNGAIYQVIEGSESVSPRVANPSEIKNHSFSQPLSPIESHQQKHPVIETAALVLGGLTKIAGAWFNNHPAPGARNGGRRRKKQRRRHGKW
jgi:electron transfer flavoprotein alpha subunit